MLVIFNCDQQSARSSGKHEHVRPDLLRRLLRTTGPITKDPFTVCAQLHPLPVVARLSALLLQHVMLLKTDSTHHMFVYAAWTYCLSKYVWALRI